MSSASIVSIGTDQQVAPGSLLQDCAQWVQLVRRCCAAASHPKRPAKSQAATICGSFMLQSVDRALSSPATGKVLGVYDYFT